MSEHWLRRRSTIRIIWIIFIVLLVGSVLAEFLVSRHSALALDGIFGFYALFDFLASAVILLIARLLSMLLKRRNSEK
ncbi:MAG TPA: hypothetical protein VNK91_03640 [Burkholderiaceae bacterium]|nr:hypothetical protein [Burkholderiaceae bacterium]